MMARLHLNRIEAIGPNGTSIIEFAKNITLIMGKSETGKTTIWKCVDYLFGANNDDKHKPFLASTGYDTVKGCFTCDLGDFALTRGIDETKIHVSSEVPELNSDEPYVTSTSSKKWIGRFFNKVLGIEPDFKIPWSFDGKMKVFSWRDVKQEFMTNEKRAETSDSILLSSHETNNTALLAELLYLLYKTDFSDYDAEDGTRMKKARKAAVQKYIKSKQDTIAAKLAELKEKYKDLKPEDISVLFDEVANKLKEINDRITAISDERDAIRPKLEDAKQRQSEVLVSLSKFKTLESQLTADIKRLSFIVEGANITQRVPKKTKCPFCQSEVVSKHDHAAYIEASRGELGRTIANLNGLYDSKRDLIEEKAGLAESISGYEASIKKLEEELNETLIPAQTELQGKLRNYQEIVSYQQALQMYEAMNAEYGQDYTEYEKIDAEIDFKPKSLFAGDFAVELANNYREILIAMNYTPVETVEFDLAAFDMIVNGNPKSNRSKGYSAILNSILVLALRKYMNDHGEINPHFYFMDSPLHGLMTETNDENNADDLRKGFFRYLFENYSDDQIIIIENTDNHELPSSITGTDNKVIEFTKDRRRGRYGFLDGVYQN